MTDKTQNNNEEFILLTPNEFFLSSISLESSPDVKVPIISLKKTKYFIDFFNNNRKHKFNINKLGPLKFQYGLINNNLTLVAIPENKLIEHINIYFQDSMGLLNKLKGLNKDFIILITDSKEGEDCSMICPIEEVEDVFVNQKEIFDFFAKNNILKLN